MFVVVGNCQRHGSCNILSGDPFLPNVNLTLPKMDVPYQKSCLTSLGILNNDLPAFLHAIYIESHNISVTVSMRIVRLSSSLWNVMESCGWQSWIFRHTDNLLHIRRSDDIEKAGSYQWLPIILCVDSYHPYQNPYQTYQILTSEVRFLEPPKRLLRGL